MNSSVSLFKDVWSESIVDRLAYSHDASVYQLVPKAVVRPRHTQDVKDLLKYSRETKTPVTFRTGGTSLSGQSVTEGIIAECTRDWKSLDVLERGKSIRMEPGVIGARANIALAPFSRRIGPDPASINSAMIGGIISNNASGMMCGVKNNAYHTLRSIQFILADGQEYDTARKEDYSRFLEDAQELAAELLLCKDQIKSQSELSDKIRRKYKIKNTLGYSLNAFLDFNHPLDIFAHLVVGAEGTLAFIRSVTLNTVPDPPFKTTGLSLFDSVQSAADAIPFLIDSGADAVELMDSASLSTAKFVTNSPYDPHTLSKETAGLLFEFQREHRRELMPLEKETKGAMEGVGGRLQGGMERGELERSRLWKIRKGLYPTVGSLRKTGTTVITEDLCYHYQDLPAVIAEMRNMFKQWHFDDAVIFGHAKDGNLHFVGSVDLNHSAGVQSFEGLMDDLVELTAGKFNGSLKAEHGTGRNMAPFVETEWGGDLYTMMKKVKAKADPLNILNPGVLITEDKKLHIKNLKPLPLIDKSVDLCIECGFCESICPSRDVTLTPRQRIAVARDLSLIGDKSLLRKAIKEFEYSGKDTCAVDGLCELSCPVNINTGSWVKLLRSHSHSTWGIKGALWAARHFSFIQKGVRMGLTLIHGIARFTGQTFIEILSNGLHSLSHRKIPVWNRYLPKSARPLPITIQHEDPDYIYYPSCVTRVFSSTADRDTLAQTLLDIAEFYGKTVQIPEKVNESCCGTPFSSKGYSEANTFIFTKTVNELYTVSQHGRIPILVDTSPCTFQFKNGQEVLQGADREQWESLTFIDIVSFLEMVLQSVKHAPIQSHAAMHVTCSSQKMEHIAIIERILKQCASDYTLPKEAECCGFAGDRGLLRPELTESATKGETQEIANLGIPIEGYSTSRTCEVGMMSATKQNYSSLAKLVRNYLYQENFS